MIWYLAGFVLVLQLYFWGIGLALLVLPRRYRRFWPFGAGAAGLGLQSAVVWFAAHTSLPGTDSYAAPAVLLPLGFMLAVLWRDGAGMFAQTLQIGVRKWLGLWVVMTLALCLHITPFAVRSRPLTSSALSSCDAADYAAGARVFKEFSSRNRSGFMGVPEAVSSLSVDNFYDFWLRLNHFTPSALIALNATLLGRQPYELTSLFGAVLLALNLPGVFWLARSVFRFRAGPSLAATAIYGVSPILFYAVDQVALGQLLGAPAVAFLGWAGWQAFRAAGSWRRLAGYAGALLLGDWLLLGSYNFFIVFAFVPLAGYVGVRTLWTREWARAGRWAALLALVFLAAPCLFPERVLGLAERFHLFNKTPFGWPIPGFYPNGWYGAFRDVRLNADSALWTVVLAVLCAGALGWVWVREAANRTRRSLFAAMCVLPILAGYAILLWKDARHHDNASYDAFKLFAVFYPGTLLSLCLWLQPPAGAPRLARIGVAALWLALLGVNLTSDARFYLPMKKTSLCVQKTFPRLVQIERMPEVGSVNICLQNNWDILWANLFLLHKPQYFPITEYEARHGSALKGDWDLREHYLDVIPFEPNNLVQLDDQYYLVNRRGADFAELKLGPGWYAPEHDGQRTWAWTGGSPQIILTNPQPTTLSGVLRFSVRSAGARVVSLDVGVDRVWSGPVDRLLQSVCGLPVELPPGRTVLQFQTPQPPTLIAGDKRDLTFALYDLQIRLGAPRLKTLGQVTGDSYGVPH